MAKYITPTLTITSNKYDATTNPGPTSSPLSISVTDKLDISQVDSNIVTVATTDAVLFARTDYTAGDTAGTDGGFVFLRNLTDQTGFTTTSDIYIGHNPTGDGEMQDDGAADEDRLMTLKPGEFAFFPWDMEANIHVDASVANDDALEAIVFVRTGTA
tara:strand:- start:569 stop:1042 length:474 start_codon:yes stop_codon:yes gene_type:complete